jgi:hypothetical protein
MLLPPQGGLFTPHSGAFWLKTLRLVHGGPVPQRRDLLDPHPLSRIRSQGQEISRRGLSAASHAGSSSGRSRTGMRVWIGATNSFASVVMREKVWIGCPSLSVCSSQIPANANGLASWKFGKRCTSLRGHRPLLIQSKVLVPESAAQFNQIYPPSPPLPSL